MALLTMFPSKVPTCVSGKKASPLFGEVFDWQVVPTLK